MASYDGRTAQEKKIEAFETIWALENPFEPTSKGGTIAHYIYMSSQIWATGLIITDPLGIMTEPGPKNISFAYTPSSWVEPVETGEPIAYDQDVVDAFNSGGAWSMGSFMEFGGLTYDFSHLEFNAVIETVQDLIYTYRNSEWSQWNS